MKKSKFAIVIALGLVLCLLCGVTTTFSWFSRPREESGDSLGWSGQYKISNGKNISIKPFSQVMTALLSVKMKLLISAVLCRQVREDIFAPKFLTRAIPNRMFRFS